MNKQRRKEIDKLIARVEALKEAMDSSIVDDIESVKDEEEEYMQNMPESMQSSDKYYAAEAAVSALDSAIDALRALDDIDFDDIIGQLDEAKAQ